MIKYTQTNYKYNFNIKYGICNSHFHNENILVKNEGYIVNVIYESFVIPADEDYLTARLLYKSKLYRNFFWSAAQCIEKYLKALLLLNGISVKKKGHDLEKLIEEVEKIYHNINNIDLSTHPKIKIHKNILTQINNLSVNAFIKEIQSYGSTSNRYNSEGLEMETIHLFALDNLIFNLRQKIIGPEIYKSFSKIGAIAQSVFYEYNPNFNQNDLAEYPIIPNNNFPLEWSSTTPFIKIVKNNSEYNLAREWLDKKMKI